MISSVEWFHASLNRGLEASTGSRYVHETVPVRLKGIVAPIIEIRKRFVNA